MSNQATNHARVIALRPVPPAPSSAPASGSRPASGPGPAATPVPKGAPRRATEDTPREPLLRDLVGDVLRRERLAQERTLKDVADAARISMPYLSEVERGRKEASSEVLAAAAHALGLTLADLLARTYGELTRATARHTGGARAAAPAPRHGGLCLAA